jgi:hypothetical protein
MNADSSATLSEYLRSLTSHEIQLHEYLQLISPLIDIATEDGFTTRTTDIATQAVAGQSFGLPPVISPSGHLDNCGLYSLLDSLGIMHDELDIISIRRMLNIHNGPIEAEMLMTIARSLFPTILFGITTIYYDNYCIEAGTGCFITVNFQRSNSRPTHTVQLLLTSPESVADAGHYCFIDPSLARTRGGGLFELLNYYGFSALDVMPIAQEFTQFVENS